MCGGLLPLMFYPRHLAVALLVTVLTIETFFIIYELRAQYVSFKAFWVEGPDLAVYASPPTDMREGFKGRGITSLHLWKFFRII